MVGFFFANRHSKDFSIMAMENAHRGLLPSLRRNDYEINGRDGTVSFGGESYNTRQIIVDICFIAGNERNLQVLAREVASWLSGDGLLYFDDEPERAYTAKVYEAVDTDQLIRAKRASVVFECQPFAKDITFRQSVHENINNSHMTEIISHGKHATNSIMIFVNNRGNTPITNIRIERRALNR